MNEKTNDMKFIKIKDVLDLDSKDFTLQKILNRVYAANFKIFVAVEYNPGCFDFIDIDRQLIQDTIIADTDYIYYPEAERYGDIRDPESRAIFKARSKSLWIEREHEKEFRNIFKPEPKSNKNSSEETKIQILKIIIKALTQEIEKPSQSFTRTEKGNYVLRQESVISHIEDNKSKYFPNISDDDELPHGFKRKSLEMTLSEALK